GLPAAAALGPGGAADRRPGDHRRTAGGLGVQRQPRLARRAAGRPPAGVPVHPGLPARLPAAGGRRNRAVPAAGLAAGRGHRAGRPGPDPVEGRGDPGMNLIGWFADPAHWSGPDGIPRQMLVHIGYCAAAAGAALLIALPTGLLIGHTGKGSVLVAGAANALRALPTLGLLIAAVVLLSPHFGSDAAFVVPALAVLVVLAVPPILTNAYAGVRAVPESARDAAYGIGMRRWQVLLGVELPCALPLIVSGVRSASLQLVSTATVAAYVSLGGLGRYIIDGQAQLDYTQ